jgi:hypothetical protein
MAALTVRSIAGRLAYEIRATIPLTDVVAKVLHLAGLAPDGRGTLKPQAVGQLCVPGRPDVPAGALVCSRDTGPV